VILASDYLSRERLRLQEQTRLDAGKRPGERNRLGQFATPGALAREIAEYARRLWGSRRERIRFLDPAVGTGAFYSALLTAFPSPAVEAATGVEIDRELAAAARALWGDVGLNVVDADFTRLDPPPERFNLVLTNPPYVRHHHLDAVYKLRLRGLVRNVLGRDISGLAGFYCYFMILAHRWMAQDGIGVWLVPSEFMDVSYGSALKHYLTEKVALLRVHRFDPEETQFDDALVSSAVVVFQNTLPDPSHETVFSYGGGLLRPREETSVSLVAARGKRKWSSLAAFSGGVTSDSGPTLDSFFAVRRGIATGSNRFFVLGRDEAEGIGIDEGFLKPILPGPRHLRECLIQANPDGYPRIAKQLVVIDSDMPLEHISRACPGLSMYLAAGMEKGVHRGYLATRRVPWYRQEQRPPAPFLCTYMGRRGATKEPFRFIRNLSQATAANVYLLLYPVGALKAALVADPSMAEAVFKFLQCIDTRQLIDEGRVYGGGLYKIEPAELGRVSAAGLADALHLRVPQRPIQPALPGTDALRVLA